MSNQNWMGEVPVPAPRKKLGVFRENWHILLFMLAIAAFMFWGERAKNSTAERDALHWANLAALEVQQEVIQVELTGVKLLGAVDSTGGRAPSLYRVWTSLMTKDWMLLNSSQVNKVCRHVLGTFAKRNMLNGSAIGPEALDILLGALEGKTIPMNVYVPRFSAKPNGLESCLGFSYDERSRTMTVGGRTVALLADEQPGLTGASR